MHFEKYKAQGVVPTIRIQAFDMVLHRQRWLASRFVGAFSEWNNLTYQGLALG